MASAATGFAGALFNPAVRAYVAQDAGERRVEAFALFNVFYQTGILLGPVIGLALTGLAFQVTCLTAAAVFAVLTGLQVAVGDTGLRDIRTAAHHRVVPDEVECGRPPSYPGLASDGFHCSSPPRCWRRARSWCFPSRWTPSSDCPATSSSPRIRDFTTPSSGRHLAAVPVR